LNSPQHQVRPAVNEEEQRVILGISLMILLAGNFALKYIGHSYFSDSFLKIGSPGFWLLIINSLFISGILILNKQAFNWSWSEIGLSKPNKWWVPVISAAAAFTTIVLLALFVQPLIDQYTADPAISHLLIINQNLPVFLLALVLVWITAAFLQELVFRSFFINSLDILLGRNRSSPWIAVVISSIVFGLMHAWQGIGGIIMTTLIGFVLGITYLLNGRRIWSLVVVKGVLDTITLITLYSA